jgi:carboxyl-terminal processing protease
MNAFTKTYDPHTVYFSPRTSENFNINMSLSLEGIGAVLQREDEYTKVVSLVPEGPADKSKQLFPNDKIVGVGQGTDGEIADVIGWRLDEVVQLIRGKKDTIVKLDIVPIAGGSESRTIEITRNTVKLEEQSAKSEIIEVEQFGAVHKIGIIDIPTFYIDFQGFQRGDKDYKSTTRDVQKLLVDLVEQGVEGIVVDLRDNGGGALQEARSLTGLFIDYGPTVQIRSKSNRVDILRDRDIKTVYDGPLGVLVNRLSASASEIFAGAIQDYHRGVIIGSQTFGKGTVQSLLPLNRGQLKMTQAKFYRITGESTQHKGIIPDITYPSNYNPEMIGESTLDDPLPWDKIQPTRYRERRELPQMIPQLKTLHSERIDGDAEFSYVIDATEYRHEQSNETTITLNEQQRLREKDEAEAFWLSLENKKRTSQGLAEIASLDELNPAPLVAASNTQATGIVPITDQVEEDSSGADGSTIRSEDSNAIKGNEIAVIGDTGGGMAGNNTGSVIVATSEKTDADADNQVTPDADDQTTEDRPDTYLIEAGNILLDLISISSRTAEDVRTSNKI